MNSASLSRGMFEDGMEELLSPFDPPLPANEKTTPTEDQVGDRSDCKDLVIMGLPQSGAEQIHLTVAPFPPATSGQGQSSSPGRAVSHQLLFPLSMNLH